MKVKSNRRSFIKKIGIGGVSAAVLSNTLLNASCQPAGPAGKDLKKPQKGESGHPYNEYYAGENLRRIAFPIGGMGAGMFCLEGIGAVSHMSIRHKPEIFHEPGMFAAISVKGIENGAKVVEGPVPDWKVFGQPASGNGSGGSIYGLPRFHYAGFQARFPFANINLEDEDLPLTVEITGWSPFIPGDADNSSLPVGAFEYKFKNTGNSELEAVFSFNARNFFRTQDNPGSIKGLKNGFILSQNGTEKQPHLAGDFAIFTEEPDTAVDYCWFRGGWFDPLTIAWETVRSGNIKSGEPVESGAPGASLFVPFKIKSGEERIIKLLMTWYVPLSDIRIGGDAQSNEKCDPASGCCNKASDIGLEEDDPAYASGSYKPWYSKKFKDVFEVAAFWTSHYEDLRHNSSLFSDAFFSSSLPPEVIEAIAANLTILKSPTVMRQYDGRLWNYEGCGDTWGCCHGSCTHVWNYAQAIPHLFPALERTLRQTEFCESQNEAGHQTFRSALPIRPVDHNFYAAADGQLGGIMKAYREWRISGDNEWLRKMYPMLKQSMDYCILTWDPRKKGVVEEPHHNTYDIEFWGPDALCTGFYLGALNAIMKMGDFAGDDVTDYREIYEKGRKFMESELFNGEYFFQKIQVTGLNAPNPIEASEKSIGGEYSDEARALLGKEGPKYQYGTGCLSDGVLGAWIARMCGMEDPWDAGKIGSHLISVHKYNLKKNLSDHANPQRPAYAMGDEGGLLLCSWPKGGKLSLPFVYSDEVWTGIEYQVASHLMLMGQVDLGLEIVRTCRDRYDGRVRNPFNEYECGHWYARALSSYGMLQGLTGIRYDSVEKALYIDSRVGDFTVFISVETGFGTVSLSDGKPSVNTVHGKIEIEKVLVSGKEVELNIS